jgi:mycothiol synthase
MSSVRNLQIAPFDPSTASGSDWVAWNDHHNAMLAEREPDDPPMRVEDRKARNVSQPSFIKQHSWAVRQPGFTKIVASGHVMIRYGEDNQHLALFNITVRPEMRRKGIGTTLLKLITEAAVKADRRVIEAWANQQVPAGDAFMKRVGARVGMSENVSHLDLSELDHELMKTWQRRAAERASGFELGMWDGPYPEDEREAALEMLLAMNTAPTEDADWEDQKPTLEHLIESEESMSKREEKRLSLFAREKQSGNIAALTEMFWHPNYPEELHQGDTVVKPEYRNRGIGRWIKAAMIEKAIQKWPQSRRVNTGNAASNDAMLSINYEMGFKPSSSTKLWQVSTDSVLAYLGGPT